MYNPYSHTIELLEAEIDSLKDAYKTDSKGLASEYSSRILSHKKALKTLKSAKDV